MGQNGLAQEAQSGAQEGKRAKRRYEVENVGVRRLNLERQDDLRQLVFRRSINNDSLEGIGVAKLSY
jgi:hypothetical protein